MGVNGKIWLTFRCKKKSPDVYFVICTTEKNCQEKLVIIHVYEAESMSGKCMQITVSGEVYRAPTQSIRDFVLPIYCLSVCL